MDFIQKARQEALERAARERRIRAQFGWGISDTASPETREAWSAIETSAAIGRGEATVADLPEAYGGMPRGTTRRAFRARQAWIAEQEARMKFEEEERKKEEFLRDQILDNIKKQKDLYDFESQKEKDFFDAKNEASMKLAELELGRYINDEELNPSDPESAAKVSAFMVANPILQNSTVAKGIVSSFENMAENIANSLNVQRSQLVESTVSEARSEGLSEREIASARRLDKEGNEILDLPTLRKMIDTTKGKRVLAQEERRQPEDTRTDLQKAQDQLADAESRLGAYVDPETGEVDEDLAATESYRRAKADALEAESRLKRLRGRDSGVSSANVDRGNYSEDQINEVKRVARNPQDPRSKAAIRFLNSIGESY